MYVLNIYQLLDYYELKMQNRPSSQLLHKQEQESFSSDLNPFEEENLGRSNRKKKQSSKPKKERVSKKEKKVNKKKQKERKQYDSESQEDAPSINSMFDDEAESGDEEEEMESEREDGFDDQESMINELYNRPNATQKLLMRFQGKNERQINAQYSKKAKVMRQGEQMFPTAQDPKVFVVQVRPNSEDNTVLCILNKARHVAQKEPLKIVSAIALKKKYPSRILIEAFSLGHIYEDLNGFNDVYLSKKVVEIQRQNYIDLLTKNKEKKPVQWKSENFVRIKVGLYEGDLGKISKVKKNSADVLLVPRLNIQQIMMKIVKQSEAKKLGEKEKQQILNLFINPKQKNYKERPGKRTVYQKDLMALKQLCPASNIKLADNGLILINYSFEDLDNVYGSYLPIEVMPFFPEGNFIEEMKGQAQNLATKINFQKGDEVEIIAGNLQHHYGTLVEIKQNLGVIRCKDKKLKNEMLYEPLQNLAKRFKQGQRVKITSGIDGGKSGIVLKVNQKQVEVLTSNQTSIKVSKRNLENFKDENICKDNVHTLKRYDLIRTNKNSVGVVLSTSKQSIRMIDTNNVVQMVSNMDFDQKILVKNFAARNDKGDTIKEDSIVFIRNGANQLKKCRVIRVYKQHLFLFNDQFQHSGFLTVQLADNCALAVQNDAKQRYYLSTKEAPSMQGEFEEEDKQIRVGQPFVLKTGALKGYQGIVKSITDKKIEVRLPNKGLTEWVSIESLRKKRPAEVAEVAITPNRYECVVSQRGGGEEMN